MMTKKSVYIDMVVVSAPILVVADVVSTEMVVGASVVDAGILILVTKEHVQSTVLHSQLNVEC